MSELRRSIVSGLTWHSASALASQAFSVAFAIVLARLLAPSDFGLVAMVTVVAGFAAVTAQLGLGSAIVQARCLSEEQLSSIFWLNLGAGLLLMLLFMALAPALAAFYGEPALIPLTRVLAVEFPLQSLCLLQLALARRELRFRRIAWVEACGTLAGGLAAVTLALLGFGVWSLVARPLGTAAFRSAAYWPLAAWRPRATFRWGPIRELVAFGGNLIGTQTLGYWTRNLDTLLIGRFVGADALGFYNAAYRLLLVPLANGTRVARQVLFPSLSRIQGERERTKSIFLRSLRSVALLCFPTYLGLLAVVETAVPVLLGDSWIPMIPIARIFCVLGLLQSLSGLNGTLYLSQGRADLQLRWGLLFRLNAIAGIAIGLNWGPVGVATGYTLASLLNYVPNTRIAGGLVGLTAGEALASVRSVFLCAVFTSGAVWLAGRALSGACPQAAVLLLQVALGAGLYLGLLLAFRVRAWSDVLRVWRDRLPAEGQQHPASAQPASGP